MSEAHAARDRAAQWIIAREQPGWSGRDQAALDAWLAQSDTNKAAFWRLELGWQQADRVAALGPAPDADTRTLVRLSPGRWWKKRQALVALAASLSVVAAAWLFHSSSAGPAGASAILARAYATEVGGHGRIGLPDGSKVELNTDTKLRAALDGQGRSIWLDQGEAFFEVAHQQGHPFVVHAGSRAITVLGTKFSVRRQGDQVRVSVLEGRVRVDDVHHPASARSTTITEGDIALSQGGATLVTAANRQRVDDALSWREGLLSFDQERLGDIAVEFNRYNRRHIAIDDPQIADLRIGGAFPARHPAAFARLLRDAYGLKVTETHSTVEISY